MKRASAALVRGFTLILILTLSFNGPMTFLVFSHIGTDVSLKIVLEKENRYCFCILQYHSGYCTVFMVTCAPVRPASCIVAFAWVTGLGGYPPTKRNFSFIHGMSPPAVVVVTIMACFK